MDLTKLDQEITVALMLIRLGKATYDEIRTYFAGQIDDDAKLAEIMTEVDARLARRS